MRFGFFLWYRNTPAKPCQSHTGVFYPPAGKIQSAVSKKRLTNKYPAFIIAATVSREETGRMHKKFSNRMMDGMYMAMDMCMACHAQKRSSCFLSD
jgi:hypothetical protein